jgi:predicted transcriptional regulator of viral defense system
MKYIDIIRKEFSEKFVFSLRDIYLYFKDNGLTKQYLWLLLHNLIKKKEIIRISRGKYTFMKDSVFFAFAFTPFYFGLQDALSLRNLWEQEVNSVIITTNNIKPGIREISCMNILLRRIKKKYFFGFDYIKYYDYSIPVSDLEKIIIDFVYYKEYLSKETIGNFKDKIDLSKLNKYLKFYNNGVKNKVYKLLEL